MKVLFGEWDTTYDDRQWATDILQAVIKEKPHMRNMLRAAFEDEGEKERLLTHVCLLCSCILSSLTMFLDSVWQRWVAEYHYQ